MNAAKNPGKHSWIAPVVALILGAFCFWLPEHFSYEYRLRHNWQENFSVLGFVLGILGAGRLLWIAVVSQNLGPVFILGGLGAIFFSGFNVEFIIGLIVGLVLIVLGVRMMSKLRDTL